MKFHTLFTWKKTTNLKEIYFNNQIAEVLNLMMADLSDDIISPEWYRQVNFEHGSEFLKIHRYQNSLKDIKKAFIENWHTLKIEDIGMIFDKNGVTKRLKKIVREPHFQMFTFHFFKDISLDESSFIKMMDLIKSLDTRNPFNEFNDTLFDRTMGLAFKNAVQIVVEKWNPSCKGSKEPRVVEIPISRKVLKNMKMLIVCLKTGLKTTV